MNPTGVSLTEGVPASPASAVSLSRSEKVRVDIPSGLERSQAMHPVSWAKDTGFMLPHGTRACYDTRRVGDKDSQPRGNQGNHSHWK